MNQPVRVGLAGAGPWARAVVGPTLAAGPETQLAGVWSRTAAHAQQLADRLRVPAFESFDMLVDECEALAIAVAPDAQPELATQAAKAGRALLLEKPLGVDVDGARRVVEAVHTADVRALVTLSYRFAEGFTQFVDAARRFDALGARGCFLSGAFLAGSDFATPWRLEHGCLLDVGPHLLDLHEAALGDVVALHAGGDVHGWVSLTLEHASGITSQASVSCHVAAESRTELELFGPSGTLMFDGRRGDPMHFVTSLRSAFAAVARGGHHEATVDRALHLQELIAVATAQLTT